MGRGVMRARGRSLARRTIALGAMAVGAMPGGVTGGFLQ